MSYKTVLVVGVAIVALLIDISSSPIQAQEKPSPTFDCTKAQSSIEKLIGTSADLAKLDVELLQTYRRAASIADDPASLKTEQRSWLKSRNTCSDAECLSVKYRRRIDTLKTLANGHGAAAVNDSASSQVDGSEQPSAPPTGTRKTRYRVNPPPPYVGLNLRRDPSPTGELIEKVATGTLLAITERRPDGWWKATNERTGSEGWLLSRLKGASMLTPIGATNNNADIAEGSNAAPAPQIRSDDTGLLPVPWTGT